MPTISSFYGILVRMYYLPRRALNLVLDWPELHQDELRANWTRIEVYRNSTGINTAQGRRIEAAKPFSKLPVLNRSTMPLSKASNIRRVSRIGL
jgi:hypothetical protein